MCVDGDSAAPASELDHPIVSDELGPLFAGLRSHRRLLIAVSGGADSMSLMYLLKTWRDGLLPPRPDLIIATVDHGLRSAAQEEARWVGERALAIGLPHRTLQWRDAEPATGLQAAAREARYRLLGEAARDSDCDTIVLAHTRDDQAETFLMRLARGSGVDGLSAMPSRSALGELHIARPLLTIAKAQLVATMRHLGHTWCEDPSNADRRFERVRVRNAGATRDSLGLSSVALARSAHRIGRAREALDRWTAQAMHEVVDAHDGAGAIVAAAGLAALPDEIALRLLQRLLWAFGGDERPPRLTRLETMFADLGRRQEAMTLGGCEVLRCADHIVVMRELGRHGLPTSPIAPGEAVLWDRRFRLQLDGARHDASRLEVRPLAQAGLKLLLNGGGEASPLKERGSGPQFAWLARGTALSALPERAWRTLPSIWDGRDLMAIPHLGAQPPAIFRLTLQSACRVWFETGHRLWKGTLG